MEISCFGHDGQVIIVTDQSQLQSWGHSSWLSQLSHVQFQQEFFWSLEITNCIVFEAAQCFVWLFQYGVMFKFIIVSYGTSLNLNDGLFDRSFQDNTSDSSTRQSIRYEEMLELFEDSR